MTRRYDIGDREPLPRPGLWLFIALLTLAFLACVTAGCSSIERPRGIVGTPVDYPCGSDCGDTAIWRPDTIR